MGFTFTAYSVTPRVTRKPGKFRGGITGGTASRGFGEAADGEYKTVGIGKSMLGLTLDGQAVFFGGNVLPAEDTPIRFFFFSPFFTFGTDQCIAFEASGFKISELDLHFLSFNIPNRRPPRKSPP